MNLFAETSQYTVLSFIGKDQWAEARKSGIGGSDASSFMGCGFRSLRDLWFDKKFGSTFKGNALTEYGTAAEPHLRALWGLKHPEKEMHYEPDAMLQSRENPWMRYSPDGLLVESKTGRKGIWECKTYLHRTRMQTEKDWGTEESPTVPLKYYCQVLHGLIVTGFDFVDFSVEIRHPDGHAALIERHLERCECTADMETLLKAEAEGWEKYFRGDEEPPLEIKI